MNMMKMKKTIGLALVLGLVVTARARSAELPRSSPEAQGLPSSAVLAFVEALEQKINAVHSFMLMRHGQVVAEGFWNPYGPADPHMLFSLSKSFTSTAVGMAVAEGKMTIDDPVLPYFPEDAPAEPSANLKAMRVRDLLAMSSGHDGKVLGDMLRAEDGKWKRAFLAAPVDYKPGTHFVYNTPATYMLSAIVQKVTGATVLDYLAPRLFEPLGIQNPTWEKSPEGISTGGFGLKIKTEDIARFGQLYLQKGEWNGRQLLPAAWVAAATSRQTSNGSSPTSDWEQGYGYQFWRCRHGFYRGDGAFGQFCIVMPEKDVVLAITSGTRDMAGVMNLAWDVLLPALQAGSLPADDAARTKLGQKLAALSLPVVPDRKPAPLAAKVSGRTYTFAANDQKIEAVSLVFAKDGPTAVVRRTDAGEQRVPLGRGTWKKARTSFLDGTDQPVAASGAWTSDDSYGARFCLYETPFCTTLGLKFAGDELLLDSEANVAQGQSPTKRPQLVGQAVAKRGRASVTPLKASGL